MQYYELNFPLFLSFNMNEHLYFFPVTRANELMNSNVKQVKLPSTHLYPKKITANDSSNYEEGPSTKEKSDFSLYSFTTNNDLPQKSKNLYEKNHSPSSVENTRNEILKAEIRSKIKSAKKDYESLSAKCSEIAKHIETLEKIQKTQSSKPKTEETSSDLKLQIKNLESEIAFWRKKYENTEKNNFHEIAKMKLMFRNSIISSDSDIPEEKTDKDELRNTMISELKEKIEVMIKKNMDLNKMLNRLLDELGFLKIENQASRDDFFSKVLMKIKKESSETEKSISNKLENLQKEARELKIEAENKTAYNDSHFLKTQPMGDELLMKKLALMENRNKELETELENLKLQYWNLEKKMQYDSLMGVDAKFTEEHLENLVYQTKKENYMKEEEMKVRVKTLEKQKENLQIHKKNNKEATLTKPGTSYRFLSK